MYETRKEVFDGEGQALVTFKKHVGGTLWKTGVVETSWNLGG